MILAKGLEGSAFSKFSSPVETHTIDGSFRKGQELVDQFLRFGATCRGRAESELDAVEDHQQEILLLVLPNRDRMGKVDVKT